MDKQNKKVIKPKKNSKKNKKSKEMAEPTDELTNMTGVDLLKNRDALKEKLVDSKLTRNML